MSLAIRVLVGLIAGLVVGVAISAIHTPVLLAVGGIVEPLGTLFMNAIRMTVIPLVVASLVVGVASAPDTRTIGRIGGRAVVLFLTITLAASAFAVLTAYPLLRYLHIDSTVAAAFRESAAGASGNFTENAKRLPTFAQWFVDLVPANTIRAAASDAMLPLIISSVLFGLALASVESEGRQVLVRLLQTVVDTMLTLVRWILACAPIGVFALAVPLAMRMGIAVAGAIVYYIALLAAISFAFGILVLYPAAVLGGGVPLGRFAKGIGPAQAVAFATRSSLACLPAMIAEARTRLKFPEEITNFLIPFATPLFHIGTAIGETVGVLFIARLYGVTLNPAQLITVVVTVLLTTLGSPGVPAGGVLSMVPVLVAVNVPVEGIGVLLAVDTIPDMFRTTGDITGDMTVACIVARFPGRT